jgi:acyl-CoA thioester hydrolase
MNIFKTKFRITWSETDALAVMHFSNYFRLCERAEEEFSNIMGFSFDGSVMFPRVKAFCEYKFPLKYNDYAVVELEIKEIGKGHITYRYNIYNETEKRDASYCEITVASIDKNFKPIPIPNKYIERLEKFINGQ